MPDLAALLAQLTGRPEPASDPALAMVKVARASLEALVLKLGQTIEAKVTAQLPGGVTQFTAGSDTLVLKLAAPLPVDTAVKLTVNATPAGQPQVTVTPLPAPAGPVRPPLPPTLPALALPAASTAPPPAPVVVPKTPVLAPDLPSQSQPPAALQQLPVPMRPTQPGIPQPASTAPPPPSTQPAPPPSASPIQQTPTARNPQPIIPAATAPSATLAPADAPLLSVQPSSAQPVPHITRPPIPAQSAAPQVLAPLPSVVTVPTLALPPTTTSPQAAPAVVATMPAPQPASAPALPAPLPAIPTASPLPAAAVSPVASLAVAVPSSAPPLVPQQPVTAVPVPPAIPVPPAPPPATSAPARPVPAPVTAPPPPQVLADPVQAAARQDSIVPLLAKAVAALAAPNAVAALPRPVLDAIVRVLAGRLDLNRTPLDGRVLRDAMLKAGVVSEPVSRPQADARSSLLSLRAALTSFLGGEVEAIAPVAPRPPPPLNGEPARASEPRLPAMAPGEEPVETARQLLGHTDAALSRLKLLQHASAPDARPGIVAATPELRVEIPLMLGAETGILQLLVERDAKHKSSPRERGWRMRFALNFSMTGEIGAEIALLGRSANVSLWAAEPQTADALEAMLPELTPALARHGLDVTGLRVRRGVPGRQSQAPGQLLDSAR